MLAGALNPPGYAVNNGVTTVGSMIGTKKSTPMAVVMPQRPDIMAIPVKSSGSKGSANTGNQAGGRTTDTSGGPVTPTSTPQSILGNINPALLVVGGVVLWFLFKRR